MPAAWVITTNADTPDANPGNGTAKDINGKISLRSAVQEANALFAANPLNNAHVITFADAMTVELTGPMDSFRANILVNQARALPIGGVLDPVVITGNGTFRLFEIAADSHSAFGGPFQICGGSAPAGGGGAFTNWGTLTLSDCEISNNSAASGGAIYNLGSMDIAHCSIHSNAADISGGGIDCIAESSMTIDYGTEIFDNTAGAYGGGINIDSEATVNVWNSEIYANTAGTDGGGVANSGGFTMHNGGVYLNLARGYVELGQQHGGMGGGLYNSPNPGNPGQGNLTLVGVTIERNWATVMGGAMYLGSGTTTDLENCTLQNDTAGMNGNGIARDQTATLDYSGLTNDDGPIYIVD